MAPEEAARRPVEFSPADKAGVKPEREVAASSFPASSAALNVPVYLDAEAQAHLSARAKSRGVDVPNVLTHFKHRISNAVAEGLNLL